MKTSRRPAFLSGSVTVHRAACVVRTGRYGRGAMEHDGDTTCAWWTSMTMGPASHDNGPLAGHDVGDWRTLQGSTGATLGWQL
jgi:hypothetical protein